MVNDIFKLDDGLFEHNGELYYECDENCTEVLEYADVPTFRRVVGTGSFNDDYDDFGYLADRRDKRVYKKVDTDIEHKDYIVFSVEDNCKYCIRNGCWDCDLKNKCNPQIVKKDI